MGKDSSYWTLEGVSESAICQSDSSLQVIERNSNGEIVRLAGSTNLSGNVKGTKWKLTWLANSEELIPLTLVDFDHILTKKKLEDEDDILDLINPCSV